MPYTHPPIHPPPHQAAGGREGPARRAPGCRPVLRLCPSTNPALSSTRCAALSSCTAVQPHTDQSPPSNLTHLRTDTAVEAGPQRLDNRWGVRSHSQALSAASLEARPQLGILARVCVGGKRLGLERGRVSCVCMCSIV
jgi:hypothetical protein